MEVVQETLPDESRIWIYQAERKLSSAEEATVKDKMGAFLAQWQAHGNELKAACFIAQSQFLVLAVDESFAQPSGCSIDASVHLINSLENELGISFSTREKVAFLIDDQVALHPFNQLKAKIEARSIKPETLMFDTTINNLGAFRSKWLVPSEQTWLKRYFK